MEAQHTIRAAFDVIENLELAEGDDDAEYYRALVADEAFGAICYLYRKLTYYAEHEHATEADIEARDALKRSVREHAQRVEGELDA